jgi:hypothetical protein
LAAACSGPPESGQPVAKGKNADTLLEERAARIHITLEGQPFTTFRFEQEWDKPFLYPLRTASGTVVSRGYPVEPRQGEEQDHSWHRGIWWGHGDINGHDFWRELGRGKTGVIVPASEVTYDEENGQARIAAPLALKTPQDEIIGTVREEFAFSKAGSLGIIDATMIIHADKGQALTFGDTEDGGFGMRLADEFRQDRGAVLINSEGQKDTENIWGKPAKWIDYSTTIEGKPVGVAMFDHPSNPRHPTRWHARGYSLCAANPFAVGDFTGDESNDGTYTIQQGESLTLRYRVVIHEGETTPQQIEHLYGEFAQ